MIELPKNPNKKQIIKQKIEEHYCDMSKSFGHELVLYTMLTHKPNEYPWKKYKTFDF
jgi:hypothetical protein